MLDEALELVNILKDSKFSSFSDFNNYVLEKYGISKTKQKCCLIWQEKMRN